MATELAKAYVQIIPSARGIQSQLTQELGGAGSTAGASAGSKIGGMIKSAIAAAGIGAALKSAITEGANLQQSVGGIETLFKDNADKVRQYADEAYKTAGLSANAYMESVTGFSASLLQGLGGDTNKAAEVANMALTDMSDNANKMGTSMDSIQYAYQGFAKQNYTMLDNLKLGYGGTKEEMTRLLADAQKITGVKYDMSNLSDVYSAIHVIQGELDITGTTAKEAASTLSGSFASMKGAFSNVIGNLTLGGDMKPALSALKETVIVFVGDNLLPALANLLGSLPGALVDIVVGILPALITSGISAVNGILAGITEAFPGILTAIIAMIPQIIQTLQTGLPQIISGGVSLVIGLVQGIVSAIPQLAESIPQIITTVVNVIMSSIDAVLDAGVSLLQALITAIPLILPPLIDAIPQIIQTVVTALTGNIDTVLDAALTLLYAVIDAIPIIVDALIPQLPDIIFTIINALIAATPKILSATVKALGGILGAIPEVLGSIAESAANIGLNLVKGLWNGISDATSWVLGKIEGFGTSILNGIKSIFGIHSPSRVMRDQIGKNLMLGLANGIDGNTNAVSDAIDDVTKMTTGTLDSNLSISARAITEANTQSGGDRIGQVVSLLSALVGQMGTWKVVLDSGETIGWIDKSLQDKNRMAARGNV